MPSPTIVVLTALPVEYKAVRGLLSRHRATEFRKTQFELGELPHGQGTIALALTTHGNQAAGIIAERAILAFAPRALLFVGVAGGLDGDLELGDLVVATKIYGYHGGKVQADGFLARPQAWEPSYALAELARSIVLRDEPWTDLVQPAPEHPPQVHFKPIAAGEIVLNSRTTPLAQQLHTNFNDAVAIEMESAGIAKAGHLNDDVPYLIVRGISDRADGNKHAADKTGSQTIAATHAAAFALTLAARIIHASNLMDARGALGAIDMIARRETTREALSQRISAATIPPADKQDNNTIDASDRNDQTATLRAEAERWHNLGNSCDSAEDFEAAIVAFRRAHTIWQEIGFRVGEASALHGLGRVLKKSKRPAEAVTAFQNAETIFKEIDNRPFEADNQLSLGRALHALGRFADAFRAYVDAYDIYKETGNRRGKAHTLNEQGTTLYALGYFDIAIRAYTAARTIYKEDGDRRGEANTLHNQGNTLQALGRSDEALPCYRSALAICQELGDRHEEAETWNALSITLHALGRVDEANSALQRAHAID